MENAKREKYKIMQKANEQPLLINRGNKFILYIKNNYLIFLIIIKENK